jgi:glutamate-1-semialdehyde 2,1-aminomutase
MAASILEAEAEGDALIKNGLLQEKFQLLQAAHSKFTSCNPKSHEAYKSSLSHLPGSNTRTTIHTAPFPLTFARGESCYLESIDGTTYVDFLGEYSAGIYGHSCEPIKQAVKEALDGGWNFGGPSLFEKKLASIVVKMFGNSIEMVRFCNSGTEANLMAVGAAINFTGRKKVSVEVVVHVFSLRISKVETNKPKILVFENAYHGGVFYFKRPLPIMTMNAPYDFVLAPYNDINGTTSVISTLPPDSLAAILVEPMQGSGGCIPSTPPFLRFLRATATSLGALLIFDEVMTSRLSYGGYQNHPDIKIKPDLTTLGKWVGGGMSFGAFGGRRDIMAMFDPESGKLAHSGTFNNNVFSMRAGIVGCGILTESVLMELNERGERLRTGTEGLIHKFSTQLEKIGHGPKNQMTVSGVGSLMTIGFKGPDHDILQGLFYHHMLAGGIYLAGRGYIALSIEIREKHCQEFLREVEEFLAKCSLLL